MISHSRLILKNCSDITDNFIYQFQFARLAQQYNYPGISYLFIHVKTLPVINSALLLLGVILIIYGSSQSVEA